MSPIAAETGQPRGVLAAVACYLVWGLVPLYWKQLAGINALELIAHRHVWSLAFVLGLVIAQGGFSEVRAVLTGPRACLINFLSATLLTCNWLVYVWGGYSVMRKKSPLGSVTGLTVETLLLAPFAVAFLLWRQHTGTGALGHVGVAKTLLILSAGVITAVPLLMFAYGARRIRLSTLGLLQYLTPTVQFILGVWVYHEAFPPERLLCFGLIWAGLALYAGESAWAQRRASAS